MLDRHNIRAGTVTADRTGLHREGSGDLRDSEGLYERLEQVEPTHVRVLSTRGPGL